ncbi:hypothetical protein ES705_27727 [subsurface metagenome]
MVSTGCGTGFSTAVPQLFNLCLARCRYHYRHSGYVDGYCGYSGSGLCQYDNRIHPRGKSRSFGRGVGKDDDAGMHRAQRWKEEGYSCT